MTTSNALGLPFLTLFIFGSGFSVTKCYYLITGDFQCNFRCYLSKVQNVPQLHSYSSPIYVINIKKNLEGFVQVHFMPKVVYQTTNSRILLSIVA